MVKERPELENSEDFVQKSTKENGPKLSTNRIVCCINVLELKTATKKNGMTLIAQIPAHVRKGILSCRTSTILGIRQIV